MHDQDICSRYNWNTGGPMKKISIIEAVPTSTVNKINVKKIEVKIDYCE